MLRFIKSNYHRRWVGIVLHSQKREGITPLLRVLVIRTATGHIPRKRMLKTLDEGWVEDVPAVSLDGINRDWFPLGWWFDE